jgi:hypothetical protein
MKNINLFSLTIIFIVLFTTDLFSQGKIPIEAYGVWDRGNGERFNPADPNYDYLLGLNLSHSKWSDLQPTDSSTFEWHYIQETLDRAVSRDQYMYLGVNFGPDAPEWIYDHGVPKVYTDDVDHLGKFPYYPYYMDPDYKRFYFRFIRKLGDFMKSQPTSKLDHVAFIHVKTGCTGDEAAYKGTPDDPKYELPKTSEEWTAFRQAAFDSFRVAFSTGENPVPLLFNAIEPQKWPEMWNWVTSNMGSAFGVKGGALNRGHHLSGERLVVNQWKPYLVNPGDTALFSRSEMDQTWKKPFYQKNQELGFYWGAINGLNWGFSVWDVSKSALEEAGDNPSVQKTFRFFNKYVDQIYPSQSERAFIALHEGLDASDTDKFPESKYGNASKGNESRYEAICNDSVYAGRGAKMEDLYAATRGQVYQRGNQTGYNDAGWEIWPGNYTRFITQIDPNRTSIGLFRIGGTIDENSPVYSRFARAFEHESGKDIMYFKMHDDFFQSAPDTVTIKITYYDYTNGSKWELRYDAGGGNFKSAFTITCNGSKLWKTQSITLTDAVLSHKGPEGCDFALVNLDDKDDIFHMIEIEKGVGGDIVGGTSNNALLDAITWPDAPDSIRQNLKWNRDTIPGFSKNKFTYKIKVPFGMEKVPALVAHPGDINAQIVSDRARGIEGSIENRTTTFTVTAEDDTTSHKYSILFEKQLPPKLDQPFKPDPLFTRLVYREFHKNNYIEISNPGNQSLDLSNYMVAMGAVGSTPEDIIQNALNDPWEERYYRYIPGYKYQSKTDWQDNPAIVVRDSALNTSIESGESFVLAKFKMIEDQINENTLFHEEDVDVLLNKTYSQSECDALGLDVHVLTPVGAEAENPWTIVKKRWMEGALCLFKILNDSIKAGTKPVGDPQDFELVDVFGTYSGDSWAPAGDTLLHEDNHWNLVRKPEYWQGDTLPGFQGSWAHTREESEWSCTSLEDYKNSGLSGTEGHYMLADGIDKHFFDYVMSYKSTITSFIYQVSNGYETPQSIQGIITGTGVKDFLNNIYKVHPEQTLKVLRPDGALKDTGEVVANGDTLKVISASLNNVTKYGLSVTSEGLDSNAVLTAKAGSGYTISYQDSTGTVSGIPFGATIEEVRNNVTKPENATLYIIDEKDNLVPFQAGYFDTTYKKSRANGSIYFEVIAQDRRTKIVYQLQINTGEDEVYAFSHVFDVNQDLNLIFSIQQDIKVQTFLEFCEPSWGASMKLADRIGLEKEHGYVAFDDELVITSGDGSTEKHYDLKFSGEKAGTEAYVQSEIYSVHQLEKEIWGISPNTDWGMFIEHLIPAPESRITVMDSMEDRVESGIIHENYSLQVISQDGSNEATYELFFGGTDAYVTSDSVTVESTLISDIPYGINVEEFTELVTPAPRATIDVLNEFGNPVESGQLAESNSLRVISGDGSNQLIYDLSFVGTEAYVTSSSFTVDSSTISGIPLKIALEEFLESVTPSYGATMNVLDADGNSVESGNLTEVYTLKVTSEDSSKQVAYELIFLGNEAYVTSDSLSVDSAAKSISDIPLNISLEEFLELLTPAPGATMAILDEEDNPVESGNLEESYTLQVTSEDSSKQVAYELIFVTVHVNSMYPTDIRVYPNPALNKIFIRGIDENSRVIVKNILGTVIKIARIDNNGSISIKEFQDGIYFITIQTDDYQSYSVKIIKQ